MSSDPKEQSRQAFERILVRMLAAGWVRQYAFSQGNVTHLTWTERGGLAAVRLKEWSEALHLLPHDNWPLLLDILAQGLALHPASHADNATKFLAGLVPAGFARQASFNSRDGSTVLWTAAGRTCLGLFRGMVVDLGLSGDEDGLLVLFHIAVSWAPDLDTPLRF